MAIALPFTERSEGMTLPTKPEIPLRRELREYFDNHLRPKEKEPKAKKRRVEIHSTGDALTNDDVLHRLTEIDVETQAEKEAKHNYFACNRITLC